MISAIAIGTLNGKANIIPNLEAPNFLAPYNPEINSINSPSKAIPRRSNNVIACILYNVELLL